MGDHDYNIIHGTIFIFYTNLDPSCFPILAQDFCSLGKTKCKEMGECEEKRNHSNHPFPIV